MSDRVLAPPPRTRPPRPSSRPPGIKDLLAIYAPAYAASRRCGFKTEYAQKEAREACEDFVRYIAERAADQAAAK